MPVAAVEVAASPVERYYGRLKQLRIWMRRYTPYTYIAYKTLVPSREDDLIGLASKIGDFVTLRFFLQFCAKTIHPAFAFLPFLPFILDLGWISYHWIRGHEIAPLKGAENPHESRPRDRVASLFMLALGLSSVFLLNRHLPDGG